MRIAIRIDEQLLKKAKQLAIQRKQSLTAVIEDALRESLARQNAAGQRPPVHLPVFSGKGLLSGVDLDDNASLLDLMETTQDSD